MITLIFNNRPTLLAELHWMANKKIFVRPMLFLNFEKSFSLCHKNCQNLSGVRDRIFNIFQNFKLCHRTRSRPQAYGLQSVSQSLSKISKPFTILSFISLHCFKGSSFSVPFRKSVGQAYMLCCYLADFSICSLIRWALYLLTCQPMNYI